MDRWSGVHPKPLQGQYLYYSKHQRIWIGSVNIDQTKINNFSLKDNPRPPKTPPNPKTDKETNLIYSVAATAEILTKKILIESATALKNSLFNIFSYLASTPTDLTNTIHRCLTERYPIEWKLRRSHISIVGEIL